MKNELGTAGATVGAIALVLLFGGLALAIYPGWAAIGCWAAKVEAPAWIQAVGSILAIMFAVAIAAWQTAQSRSLIAAEHQRKALVMLEAIRTFVDLYAREIQAIAAMIDGNLAVQSAYLLRIDPDAQFMTTERSAQSIPLHDLPDVKAVRLVVELMNHIRTDRNAIANLKLALEAGDLARAPGLYSLKGHVDAAMRLLQKTDAAIERVTAG
ncbi:hypothetical protein VLK31_02750 [Variovorax sp. H27-G14]|uniref:hypothetical protein n=1 Tax=Variovorax sp. H27-G14 TaxID=3111914 RepID=UPI0038FD18F0